MKKVGFTLLLLSVFAVSTFAQSPLSKGEKQLNAGVGFSGWGVPIYAGMDFGVYKDITIGFEASFRSYSQKFVGEKFRSTIFGFAGNGNYHFNSLLQIPSQWDVYAGLSLGYYVWNVSSDYPGDGESGIGLSAQVGARYFFKNNFGINLEFGGGNVSGGKFGITYIF